MAIEYGIDARVTARVFVFVLTVVELVVSQFLCKNAPKFNEKIILPLNNTKPNRSWRTNSNSSLIVYCPIRSVAN